LDVVTTADIDGIGFLSSFPGYNLNFWFRHLIVYDYRLTEIERKAKEAQLIAEYAI
jgi:hypothetical protein